MADISKLDEEVLRVLINQGLITKIQESRLRMNLKRDMKINEAISKTPLVDAVKLASVQSLAAQNLRDTKPVEPGRPSDMLPIPRPASAGASETEVPVDRENFVELKSFKIENLGPVNRLADTAYEVQDDVPTYDLDAGETHPPPGFFGTTQPAAPTHPALDETGDFDELDELDTPGEEPSLDDDLDLEPVVAQDTGLGEDGIETIRVFRPHRNEMEREVSSVIEDAFQRPSDAVADAPTAPQSADRVEVLPEVENLESFQPKGGHSVQTFDMVESEGIPLIEKVNAILAAAVDDELRGFVLDIHLEEENLRRFTSDGELAETETIEQEMLIKVLNRLKVMARLQPWRPQAPEKGQFRIKHGLRLMTAYVRTDPSPSGPEILTLHFRES